MTNWWLAMLITYLDLMHAADAPLWLRHSPAALGEIKVHWSFSVFFFLFLWVGWWRGGCHHFHQQRGCLSAGRSRRLDEEVGERCHNGDERIESQQLISFTSPFVWPFGRGRGAGTTCKDDAERNIISRRWGGGGGISRRFCPCLQNLATSLSRRNTRWISSVDRKKAKVATVELKCPWVSKLTWQRTAVGLVPARENLTAVGSEPQLSPPSREPGRAKSKHMKSTRHRKLSLFKSEPLQDFTALSGTTPTTVRLTRVRTRFRCGLQK